MKTARELAGEHEEQLLNYLFLRGSQHGKLINYEHPLRALLALTPRRTIPWVNLARRHDQLASLSR